MKILVATCLIGLVAITVCAQSTYEYTRSQWDLEEWQEEEEPQHEVLGYFLAGFPGQGDFDLYENTYGMGFQYRNWNLDPFGFAFGVGFFRSDTDSSSDGILPEEKGSFDGHIMQYPISASILYQILFTEDWGLTLDLGVAYVFIASSMEYTWNDTSETEEVDIGNGFIVHAVLDGDYALSEDWRLFGGFGLQQDLVRGDMSLPNENLRDNELKGFFARFGVRYIF